VFLFTRTIGESTTADLLRVTRAGAAVVLLALFCALLIAPLLFASDDDSRLPACCRRNGVHKCSTVTVVSPSGLALFAAPCRLFPGPQALPMPAGARAAVISAASSNLVLSKSPLQNVRGGSHDAVFDRSHQKRGPPIRLF